MKKNFLGRLVALYKGLVYCQGHGRKFSYKPTCPYCGKTIPKGMHGKDVHP